MDKFSHISDVSNGDDTERRYRVKNTTSAKTWVFRIIFLLLLIFIWILYISPLLGGIEGILVGTLEVIDPKVDYYNRNNTMHVVYNPQCNLTVNSSYTNRSNNISCPNTYVFNGTHCVPECIKWNPGGDVYFWLYRVSTVLGAAIQILTCFLFLVSWLQAGRAVWRFPSITSFYLMVTIFIQSLAVFAGSIVPERFYCSSPALAESREASTIACKIQGALYQYGIFSFMLWYLCAFVNLALLVTIPFSVGKIMKHRNKIHVLEFVTCFFFPIIIVLLSYFGDSDGQGYRILNVPEVCLPQDLFIFVTIYLPGILFTLILGSLAMLILYKLFTQQFVSSAGSGLKRSIVTDLAFQVILFLLSFGLLIWIIMVDFIVYENVKLPYKGFLEEYIICITEAFGNESCCREVFRDYYPSWLSTLAGFSTTVWAAPALLGLSARLINQKFCNCIRDDTETRTKVTTTGQQDGRNILLRDKTLQQEDNTGYRNPYISRRAPTLGESEPHKVSDKFKKSNTVDDN